MCDRELSDPKMNRLAEAIFVEIQKQFDVDGPIVPSAEQGMRHVLIEGCIDLVKVAAALSKRCCMELPDIETVVDERQRKSSVSVDALR